MSRLPELLLSVDCPGPMEFPSLAQRVKYNSRQKRTVPVPAAPTVRPLSYKAWTEEQMSHAYEAYQNGTLSVHPIAEEYHYGVPESTLQDRVSGHVLPGTKSGKKRYLGDDEEKELVNFLMC